MEEENLQSQINELKTQIEELKKGYNEHLHTGLDGTDVLKKSIKLENDQHLTVGLASMATAPIDNSKLGNTDEQIQFSIGVGQDDGQTGFLNKVKNMQLNFLHQPNNTSKHSFIDASRDAVVGSISVTSGQNTATITGYNFITNELAGAIINITGSSGLVESKIIASNTSTQITITSTWVESTNGSFEIFFPVYLGSANRPYARNYVTEGTGGGIRFGIGTTAGGQNGLLYMDAAGDLYWRNKSGYSSLAGGAFTSLGNDTVVTISSGSITPTNGFLQVATEGGASSDDLDTIDATNVPDGSILVIRADSSTQTVVAKDETGNLRLAGDCILDHTEDTLTLIWSGVVWYELARSNNDS